MSSRFGHVNLIARDWRALVAFYRDVFGCEPVGTERDLSGPLLEQGSGIEGAALRGIHLRLPGGRENGPTLEIFTYRLNDALAPGMPNRTGFGHIAFIVDDVPAKRAEVLRAGGSDHGAMVTTQTGARKITWQYLRDPEGNLIELQSWSD
ncbi:MAG: VOC family protein [Opitutae bacterium]|nr:VOC family protein [Opitutae bacterium]